jgi:uncharacterized protein (TIGR03435 family)
VVDKKGLRIQAVEAGEGVWGSGPNMVRGAKMTMAQLAVALSGSLDRPVKNLTALAGFYDFDIRWTPDMPSSTDPSDLPGSVYSAVQELGLRLQAQKVPAEIVGVDHTERVPAEN